MPVELLGLPSEDGITLLGAYDEEPEEYSAVRSGVVDFVESAIGAGDELDATVRLLAGQAKTWDEAITKSRGELAAFQEDNPLASSVLSGAGLVSGLFIPGAGMAKIAQTGTKLNRALKVGGLTAAEGAGYGFLSGEGEERATSAGIGALAGGALGTAVGGFLTKNADELAEATKELDAQSWAGKGSHIGGEEGFVSVGQAREAGKVGSAYDTNLAKRKVKDVTEDAPIDAHPKAPSGVVGNIFLTTKEWIAKNVGTRAAKLAEDAETMARHDQRELEEVFDTVLQPVSAMFESNRAMKSIASRMNKSIKKERRATWDDLFNAARNQEEKDAVKLLQEQMTVLQGMDFVKIKNPNYLPTKALTKITNAEKASIDQYYNPLIAVKELAEEISTSRALMSRFDINVTDVKQPKIGKFGSRIEAVIDAIEKKAIKEGASSDVAANLANGLRSQFIASKKGGNTAGAVLRRAVSAALLGNPLNALLNIAEGITAPIYQNGVLAWAKTLPKAIMSTFNQQFGIDNAKWMSTRQLGLDKEFMGELANAGEKAFREAAENQRFVWNRGVVRGLDTLGKGLYKLSGVATVNRMGQEMLSSSAIQRGIDLAKKGDLDKLRKHDGMRGLTESEFQATVNALKNEQYSNPWVLNFAGSSLNKWQPVSASALPKAFHDNPNGRMAYSMLSYMNKQMNSIRTDIGLNLDIATKKGLNSKEGAEAARAAMMNTAKYTALFGVFAGIWDDGRKTLDLSKDKDLEDLLTPEGVSKAFLNQLASNMSSGIINIRAEEFGGKPVEFRPAPVAAASNILSGVATTGTRLLTGEEEPLTPLLRSAQTYAPGIANIDRIVRATTGERLFTD